MGIRESATSHGDRSIVMSRTYEAPRLSVFRAWTNPQQWSQWFAPEPMTAEIKSDARPGGEYTLIMRDPEGNEFVSTGVFEEVDEPERIVYRDSVGSMPRDFLDMVNKARGEAPGTPIPDGIATVTFEELGDEQTKMTFSEEFESKALRDAWVEMQMVEGLDAGFDQLESQLALQPEEMSC